MRLILSALLLGCLVCVGCGGGDKIKVPTDTTSIQPNQVKISGWGGGGGDTKPAK